MRAIYEEARLDQIDSELETAHAEISVRLGNGEVVYVQAHDNGVSRYFVLSQVSYFRPDREETDEDILEEYNEINGGGGEEENVDFIDFLSSWNAERGQAEDGPYHFSRFSPFFGMAEALLDGLMEDVEEEIEG